MSEEVTKEIKDVDKLFSEIIINGTSHLSSRAPSPQPSFNNAVNEYENQQQEESHNQPQQNTVGQDVKAINLNEVLHNIRDEEARNDISDIKHLIPNQATEDNKLADKAFVNSTVSTNTANYISNDGEPFTSVAQLEAYSGTVTNNDYAIVTGTDEQGNTFYDRYKATVTENPHTVSWGKEYRLNNSGFTAVQWEAINSGITEELVEKIGEGGTGAIEINEEDYEELPEEEKMADKLYLVPDSDSTVKVYELPIGAIIAWSGASAPSGYLTCNGREILIEDYPELYEVIGNLSFAQSTREGYFKLPDLREVNIVGAGENTTLDIASHDIYTLGQFKDDQFQAHKHAMELTDKQANENQLRSHPFGGQAQGSTYFGDSAHTPTPDTSYAQISDTTNGRSGTTTHGKQIGFNYIIRALNTTGVLADDVEVNDNIVTTANVFSAQKVTEEIEAVDNKNNYSTTETVVGKWIDGKPIYKKSLNIGNFNFVGNRQNDISHNINNLEKAIKTEYYFDYAGYSYNYWGEIQNARSNATICSFYTDNSLNVTNLVITIEYTKTTD